MPGACNDFRTRLAKPNTNGRRRNARVKRMRATLTLNYFEASQVVFLWHLLCLSCGITIYSDTISLYLAGGNTIANADLA